MGILHRTPRPDFPTVDIPASQLRDGMTLVGFPDGSAEVSPHPDGTWPTIDGPPVYEPAGEGGGPCVYWYVAHHPDCTKTGTVFEGRHTTIRYESKHCPDSYWARANDPVTVAASDITQQEWM